MSPYPGCCRLASGSVRTRTALDPLCGGIFLCHVLSLLCSFLTQCNWICNMRYHPPTPHHSSAGAVVFLLSSLSSCFLSLLRFSCPCPPPGTMALTQVSHQQSPLIWLRSLSHWGQWLEQTGCVMTLLPECYTKTGCPPAVCFAFFSTFVGSLTRGNKSCDDQNVKKWLENSSCDPVI